MNYRDVVNTALAEIGYQGTSNSSKYSALLDKYSYYNYPKDHSASWCKIFVDFCTFVNIGNDADKARAVMCEPNIDNCGAGCTQAVQYFKSKGRWITKHSEATTGDEIFFQKSNGAIYHTGIVIDWDNKGFYVVEGNTNGNKVAKKFYAYGDSKIAGFGRPDWYKFDETAASNPEDIYIKLAKDCIEGKYGNGLDRKHRINSLGYGNIYTKVQNYVNMILRGIL